MRHCRICLAGEDEAEELGALVDPCACRGSQQWVHEECLWQVFLSGSAGMACKTCEEPYSARVSLFLAERHVKHLHDGPASDRLNAQTTLMGCLTYEIRCGERDSGLSKPEVAERLAEARRLWRVVRVAFWRYIAVTFVSNLRMWRQPPLLLQLLNGANGPQ